MSFLGIGVGILLAIVSEPLIRQLINTKSRNSMTGHPIPESAALIMAIGSLFTAIGQLGFSWTCLPTSIHWALPIFFSVPFGYGNTLTFVYSSKYLAVAYGIFAASALASNVVLRSIFGALLPLAGESMYAKMKPQLAGTLCGIMSISIIPFCFLFWKFGAKIRQRSKIIRQLNE